MNDKVVKELFSGLLSFANLSPKKAKQVYIIISIFAVGGWACIEQMKRKKHQENIDKMADDKQRYEHEERMATLEIEKIRAKKEVTE